MPAIPGWASIELPCERYHLTAMQPRAKNDACVPVTGCGSAGVLCVSLTGSHGTRFALGIGRRKVVNFPKPP